MLRIVVNSSASGAKSYYSQGLAKEDYYTHEKETEIVGKWGGKGAELLKLNGKVNQEQFAKLCDNINPITDEQLTPRNNDNRRVGYDINFHAPKSVSIVYAITKDEEILTIFREAVKETMLEMEKDMQARVRKGGRNESRETGNLIYGEFIHTTARPTKELAPRLHGHAVNPDNGNWYADKGGIPDMHLHAHCFTFNATFDGKEKEWKAGEFGKIKKDAGYFEAYFHSAFSEKMKNIGYDIKATKKGWEIAGVERTTIDKFSRRTTEIDKAAKDKGITDARAKDQLGAKTRKGKDKSLSSNDLYKTWLSNLTDAEKTEIYAAKKAAAENKGKAAEPSGYVQKSIEHILERKSVATEREILRESLKASYGVCKPDDIIKSYSSENLIKVKGKDEILLTTKEAINEERELIKFATESKGKFAPINKNFEIQNNILNKEQQKAVKHVLSSKDGVIVVEGGAGTGKTTILKEIKIAVEAAGKKIIPVAPSAEASRGVLRNEGLENADTVTQLLMNKKMQESVRNNIILIDEAGLLGNKTMNGVFEIAKQQNALIILTGDIRQHNSVERGDGMRLLLEKSKVTSVKINEIQRQKNNPAYKQVVKDIRDKRMNAAFGGLEEMNVIHEIADAEKRYAIIASDYVATVKAKKSILIIAPTHIEGEKVTEQIREALKTEKFLGKQEMPFDINKNLNPTEVEKKDTAYYSPGMSIQFHQNVKGVIRGSIYDVSRIEPNGNVFISDGEKEIILPMDETMKFSVYEKAGILLAKGDAIKITKNGFSLNDKRLDNGDRLRVKGFDTEGNIIAHNGNQQILLGKYHRNFTHDYCSTSHSSQAKTVDKIIISQSSVSSNAASIEQFYVSVSRGRNDIAIYTNDRVELKRSVTTSSQRTHAVDIFDKQQQQKQNLADRLTSMSRGSYNRVVNTVNLIITRR